MARTRTTKAVAQRIDLNYFKRPTPFKRAKLWLAILAPVIALAWLGFQFFARDSRAYSSGRLSEAHAVLEKQCAACHVQQAGGFSAVAADSACLACHDGPLHHTASVVANAPKVACAECHTEHRGRIKLAATRNQVCAQCHGALAVVSGGSDYSKHIRSLEDGHPEIVALRSGEAGAARDPASIKLNHALHMRAIRRGPNGPMVQLDCVTCHASVASNPDLTFSDANYRSANVSYRDQDVVLEIARNTQEQRHPFTGRELMAPPKFANACAGCHLLTFDKRFEEGAPHDKPEVVHRYLAKKFSEYILTHPAEVRQVRDPQRNLSGRENEPASRTLTPTAWVAERVAVSEELLWHKTCSQCHTVTGSKLQDVKIARWDAAGAHDSARIGVSAITETSGRSSDALPAIAPANIKLQWLAHAKFDHDAHPGFSCLSCHQNALKSTETADVLIPGIATCKTCHAPGAGYAESRCFECHTYHDWAQRKDVKPTFVLPGLDSVGH
jgi:hypothetical protein